MTPLRWRLYPMIALCTLCAGCMPFAFATPPARLTLGAAMSYASVNPEPARPSEREDDWGGAFHAQATLMPLQLWGAPQRWLDLGLGYGWRVGSWRLRHGPHVELGALFHHPQALGRQGLRLQGRTVLASGREGISGAGASLIWHWEGVMWSDGEPFDSCDEDGCVYGRAYGESAVGVHIELGADQVARRVEWTATVGLTLRIPATLSVGFAWML